MGLIKLKLPSTISCAKRCDVPNNKDIIRKIEKLEQGNKIVEGFIMIGNQNKDYPYNFFLKLISIMIDYEIFLKCWYLQCQI